MTRIQAQEFWLNSKSGRLFGKLWQAEGNLSLHDAPIILLHDSLGSVALWRDFPEQLAWTTKRTIIAYDRLGFGQSDAHPGTLPPLQFVHDEAKDAFGLLLDTLKLDQFIVLGHSVGGGMATACAAIYATRCQALISLSAQVCAEQQTLQGIRAALQEFQRPAQFQRLAKYHGNKTHWVLNAWANWLTPEFANWRLDADLQQVHCPVLIIHGDNDEYGSLRHPQRIRELVKGPATLKLLTTCGHFPHREQPAQVLALINDWLASMVPA